jgi:EAL domain-containing protein (putative c-di-GMP-specific phosphodiesterase class I)/CheY-like chemotaxis protein
MDAMSFTRDNTVQFGRRRAVPRVCVVDAKPHIRRFLADTLQELGFVTRECGRLTELSETLADFQPDLVVLGLLKPESEVTKALQVMMAARFAGRVMLFGGRASTALLGLQELGEQVGLAMLPPLATPFRDRDLYENLSPFLPIPDSPAFDVDVEEAMANNWLELWYQPKIDLREMMLVGAEALIRMRHPTWGIVPPASFIPDGGDPNLRALSEFVVERAMADWSFFSTGRTPIDMTIHLPAALLGDSRFMERVWLRLPDHAAFAKLFVEIDSAEARRDHVLVRRAARHLQSYNIGISIDDVMAAASWVDIADFPIAEMQVDSAFIDGVADDRAKRTACEMAVEIGKRLGARTVAKGLERTADCRVVCQLGFDIGQGFLFAKPMEAARFARTMLRHLAVNPG